MGAKRWNGSTERGSSSTYSLPSPSPPVVLCFLFSCHKVVPLLSLLFIKRSTSYCNKPPAVPICSPLLSCQVPCCKCTFKIFHLGNKCMYHKSLLIPFNDISLYNISHGNPPPPHTHTQCLFSNFSGVDPVISLVEMVPPVQTAAILTTVGIGIKILQYFVGIRWGLEGIWLQFWRQKRMQI